MMGVEGRRLEVPAAGSPPETDASLRNQLKRYQNGILLNYFETISPSGVQVILFLYELYYIFTQDSK